MTVNAGTLIAGIVAGTGVATLLGQYSAQSGLNRKISRLGQLLDIRAKLPVDDTWAHKVIDRRIDLVLDDLDDLANAPLIRSLRAFARWYAAISLAGLIYVNMTLTGPERSNQGIPLIVVGVVCVCFDHFWWTERTKRAAKFWAQWTPNGGDVEPVPEHMDGGTPIRREAGEATASLQRAEAADG
jgi:hypothetical protein